MPQKPLGTRQNLRGAADRHLLIAHDHIHLTRGPKEGRHGPSINATSRSAAQTHDDRAIGVMLFRHARRRSTGLLEISRHGGVAIVQDPEEAKFPSMSLNALHGAPVHFRLRSGAIAPILARLVEGEDVQGLIAECGARTAE